MDKEEEGVVEDRVITNVLRIMKSELPDLSIEIYEEFAMGMLAYYKNWEKINKYGVHFQKHTNYLSHSQVIYQTKGKNNYWVYSPAFIRVIVQTICYLFRTTILEIGYNTLQTDDRRVIFNSNLNNVISPLNPQTLWVIDFKKVSTPLESESIVVSARFPLANFAEIHNQVTPHQFTFADI